MQKFQTIRKTAANPDCPIGVGTLRRLVKTGRCPGFYSGTRFYVNYEALIEMLKKPQVLAEVGK